MATVTERLHKQLPHLIRAATHALARGESLRESMEGEVARFYELLFEALETGSPQWLDQYVRHWVKVRPQDIAGEAISSLLPAMHALRHTTYRVVQTSMTDSQALETFERLEPLFTYAVEMLAALERDAVLAEITNELNEARRAVERLDRSKSDFIAVAAHELKTPLTLIEGYSNMLGEELAPDQRLQMGVVLGGIANGTRRLKEIIEDMIDVSMIDNNLLSLSYQPVWLNRLLDLARQELREPLAQRKHSLLIDDFPGCTRRTHADPERLYQVFMNVLRNAIKYTPDGGRIHVSGRELPGFVEVTIADNGIGIPLERQEEIFEKFSRVSDVSLHSSGKTKFKGGGPGLGLPIARGILAAHGGTIWVESPGYDEKACPGSTFHLMIPIREQAPEPRTPKLFGLTDEEKKAMGISL